MTHPELHSKVPDALAQVIAANNGMTMYLNGLDIGKDFTPRSSLYNIKGKTKMWTPDRILANWRPILMKLKHGDKYEQAVLQFDLEQLKKWGPQGGVAPVKELLEDVVYPTFLQGERPIAFTTENWQKAQAIVADRMHSLGCRNLRPVGYRRVVDDMRVRDTLESNSGFPEFTRRNKPEVIEISVKDAESGKWKTYPAILLFRNYNGKTRMVWMFPMSANLVEGSFFQPLQSVLMNSAEAERFLSPWRGFEQVRKYVTEVYRQGKFIAASDFSSTDAHFQLWTSEQVLPVLQSCFQPPFRDVLSESIRYMHTIPLLIGRNEMLVGDHGVSSGSNWTNFIETIFDWIFATYVELELGEYRGMYAIGDDMSWCGDRFDKQFAEKLEQLGESVGQQIKADKTTNFPDKVKSLQRLFQRDYVRPDGQIRAVYSTIRALKSLVYPERFHKPELWSKDMEAIRAFMILENCVDHPLFDSFCRFVSDGDPNLRVFSHLKRAKQEELFRKSKLIPGLNPTYNQEKRDSSIADLNSVKFIASL